MKGSAFSPFGRAKRHPQSLRNKVAVLARLPNPSRYVYNGHVNPSPEDLRDLGFGAKLARESRFRLLNRDGTFNVERRGLPRWGSMNLYHTALSVSWPRFYALTFLIFALANTVFAIAFYLCGPGVLDGSMAESDGQRFVDAYFFSIQTLATIGYGKMSPQGLAANILVAVEAFTGLMALSIVTGLSFARFSRPTARILFSDRAVIAPYRGISAFEFRIANARQNQLLDVRARVLFSYMEPGQRARRFATLPLERDEVTFLPLHWTIVHPIDDKSPLRGVSAESLTAQDAEFLILLTATDETFSQSVFARTSYKASEVQIGARFADIFEESEGGKPTIDLRRLHATTPAALAGLPDSSGG
jgi:inward rectifier potassium channel